MLLIIACTFSCSPEDGMDGLDGINGVDGIQGVSGQNGSDGQDGVDGTNGNNGQDGVDGQDGQNGTDGQDGQDAQTYSIGDFAQGGIIFWLDATKQHGLACDIRDLNDGNPIRWYAGTNGETRATGNGIYAGENNTTIIISSLVAIGDDSNGYAALVANDLEVSQNGNLYGDWYLPSGEEIARLRYRRDLIDEVALANGGTSIQISWGYWTSTEAYDSAAWAYDLGSDTASTTSKSLELYARAIRAF